MLQVIVPTCFSIGGNPAPILQNWQEWPLETRVTVVINCRYRNYVQAYDHIEGCEARMILIPERVGYVRACNIGYASAEVEDSDYVAVANDDVFPEGDWIHPLVEALDAGVAQAGPSVQWVGQDGYWGCEGDQYRFCEGWLWMARGKTIRQAGGLYDPEFSPGYCEDMDLSIRIQRMGGMIEQIPLPVKHLRSQTFGTNREPFWTKNRHRLVAKWGLSSCAHN